LFFARLDDICCNLRLLRGRYDLERPRRMVALAQVSATDKVVDVQCNRGDGGVVESGHDLAVARAVAMLADEPLDKRQKFPLFFRWSHCFAHSALPLHNQYTTARGEYNANKRTLTQVVQSIYSYEE